MERRALPAMISKGPNGVTSQGQNPQEGAEHGIHCSVLCKALFNNTLDATRTAALREKMLRRPADMTPRINSAIRLAWCGLLSSIATIVLFLHAGSAFSGSQVPNTPPSKAPSSDGKPTMETITVEARRELERQVSHYVSTIVVHSEFDSLARWNEPICPLVAGLPRERGEFILGRISQIATTVHAPLAGEHCKANFYVVVTPNPDLLLKKWWHRNPSLFNTPNGMGYLNSFLHTQRPIRCWYNAELRSSDGGAVSPDTLTMGLSGSGLAMMQAPTNRAHAATRLEYTAVQSLSSVIIVVDITRTRNLTMGQLADYIAMVGFTEIRIDADLGGAPTILRLFQESTDSPQGLSAWDQAFLDSVYNTSQASVLQTSSIKTSMLKRIAPK